MFRSLGTVLVRFAPLFILGWLALLFVGWKLSPAWNDVTASGEVEFLPAGAPSREAETLLKDAFLDYTASSVVLVIRRQDDKLQEADKTFVQRELSPRIRALADEKVGESINNLRTFAEEGAGLLLISPDRKATLVVVELSTSFQNSANHALSGAVERIFAELRQENKVPAGLDLFISGSAVAGRDLDHAQSASAQSIERWTIAVVLVLLILILRAPFLALLPLLTVFVAVQISLFTIAILAEKKILTVSSDLRIFITVLSYGAGVDYCLLLIDRYEEELRHWSSPSEALASTLAKVGSTIAASAATVIIGIGMLAFASFGKIREAGLVIPLAISVALLATLTLGGALLHVVGRYAFWPRTVAAERGGFIANQWDRLGAALLRTPGRIAFVVLVVMLPFAFAGLKYADETNFSPLSDLPKSAPSVIGTDALVEHFPAGILGPATVLVRNDRVDFTTPEGIALIAELTQSLRARKSEFALADLRSLSVPLGISEGVESRLAEYGPRRATVEAEMTGRARNRLIAQSEALAGHVTRLDLTFVGNPFSETSIANLRRLQAALPAMMPAGLHDTQIAIAGTLASLRDLSDAKRADQSLIQLLVPLAVLLVLIVMLRRVVISVYLILSVLFSYWATLGLTYLVFQGMSGPEFIGLDWKVSIFLFTILVAVGEDYNIFLLGRVQEEQDAHGSLHAVPIALARTGAVISSCGLLMAGTFAALLSGSLTAMQQLGFALVVGVLVDTLVVRPLLVPAFLILIQRWFPGRWGSYMALGKGEPLLESPAAEDVASPVRSTLEHR